ncbi:MAG: SPASM domain-containing protein, partial [Acidobacteria bacterium]|nr:SPASM domain-containing protein [Acidobacteriota bacterium]
PESYDLAASILRSQDRIGVGIVLPVRGVVLDESVLLTGKDVDRAEPYLREILEKDRDRKLLQFDFPDAAWSAMDRRLMAELNGERRNLFPTAPSFQEKNGGCFFAWYTAAVTGNGDVRPCCLLLNPAVKPLGNVHETPLSELWHGERFTRMRHEMREVLVQDSNINHEDGEFEILERACTETHLCWLKNMFFRGDEQFYTELDEALTEMRAAEISSSPERNTGAWFGGLHSFKLRVRHELKNKPRLWKTWKRVTDSTRPVRSTLKKHLGINLTEEV